MTALDVPAIRALLAGITEGPWVAEYSREQGNCVIPADAQSTREAVAITRLYHQAADAAFIAAAPSIVAQLLAVVERVEGLAKYLDGLAPDDQHYARCIRAALTEEGQ